MIYQFLYGVKMISQLVQLSCHSYIYRGFTIHKCPRNSVTLKTAYSVSNDGNYLGRDFALAEAIDTINKLRTIKVKK